MDQAALEQKLREYEALVTRKRLEEAVHRELTIAGGLANASANVAGLIHQAQQNNTLNQNQYAGAYQGTAHMPLSPAQMGSTHPESDEDRTARYFLDGFKAKDASTYEFAQATAQLLSAKIRASQSPNRSPHCTPRHEYVVWQIFNHNWMVDVQWVGDATGGSEEEWTKHFAKLADRISEARERGDKQWGDEPPPTQFSGYAQALGQFAQHAQQAGINQQAMASSLMNSLGLHNASLAGQSQAGMSSHTGGGASQNAAAGGFLGLAAPGP